jgi:hypothetical protein
MFYTRIVNVGQIQRCARGSIYSVYYCIYMYCFDDYLLIRASLLCDKFCIQWTEPCMDVLEHLINTTQYNMKTPLQNFEFLNLQCFQMKMIITLNYKLTYY